MTIATSGEVDRTDAEYEGTGHNVDAAILDAILVANRQSANAFGTYAEVVAWGVRLIGRGEACSFWAKVRKTEPTVPVPVGDQRLDPDPHLPPA